MESATKLLDYFPILKDEKNKKLAVQIASIATATTLLYTSYRLIKNDKNKAHYRKIPEPKGSYPYVGHLFSLGELPSKTISNWHAELGPIIKLRVGAATWIMVEDPELAHKIFVTNGAETSNRVKSTYTYNYYSLGGRGVSQAQPEAGLKENRSAALTVLAPRLINEHYMGSIKEEAQKLVSRLIASSEKEGGTDPIKDLELNSMNVMFSACFGRKFNAVTDPEFINLSEIAETSMKYGAAEGDLSQFLPILVIFNIFLSKQDKMKNFIYEERNPTFKDLIEKATTSEGPNLVKSLDENGFNFSMEDKIVFLTDMVAGGTDTVSVTLHWAFAVLCHHPDVQKTVSDEIDEFIKRTGRHPEFSDRMELPYCVSVIKECMRYRPTTPFGLPHLVRKDVEVDGYIIPKGSVVMANMTTMHAKTDLYPDPQNFHPERFLSNLKTMQSAANGKLEERDHFNFGFGRRICPGIYLAEVELFSAFTQVFARSFIEPVNELPDIISARNGGLTLNPLSYKVRFVKRQNALIGM